MIKQFEKRRILFQRDVHRAPRGPYSGTAVAYWLVCHRILSEVVAHFLDAQLDLDELLPIEDMDGLPDHLGQDDEVPGVSLHRLLVWGPVADLLDEDALSLGYPPAQAPAHPRGEHLDELVHGDGLELLLCPTTVKVFFGHFKLSNVRPLFKAFGLGPPPP